MAKVPKGWELDPFRVAGLRVNQAHTGMQKAHLEHEGFEAKPILLKRDWRGSETWGLLKRPRRGGPF